MSSSPNTSRNSVCRSSRTSIGSVIGWLSRNKGGERSRGRGGQPPPGMAIGLGRNRFESEMGVVIAHEAVLFRRDVFPENGLNLPLAGGLAQSIQQESLHPA